LPADGDTLIFPAIASNFTNTNNIGGLDLVAINIEGTGYVIGGNSVTLTNLTDASNAGTNALNLPLSLPGDLTVTVNSASSSLTTGGVISGAGGVSKAGPGVLRFAGASPNRFTGLTRVSAGRLELAKSGGPLAVPAVPGNLTINGGAVREILGQQIADAATVTVNTSGIFDLNNLEDTIGVLSVVGGTMAIGSFRLYAGAVNMTSGSIASTANGMLLLMGTMTTHAASSPATISGNLNMAVVFRTINVADGPAAIDLDIPAVIANGGLTKAGAGTLRLDGPAANTYIGWTTVPAGTLELGKTGGAVAVAGILTINGGIARELFGNQLDDTSAVTVNAGGTFDLNGQTDTVGTVTVAGGTLTTLGASAGWLTAGNTSFNSAATLAMRVADAATSDRIIANGTVALGGTLSLSTTQALPIGTAITIIDNDGVDAVTGTFTNLPQGATFLVDGQLFAISYTGGTGNDVVLTRTGGPTVLRTQVNDGSVQRSRVTDLTVTFSGPVDFAGPIASAFILERAGGGAVSFQASASVVNGVTIVTLNNFTGSETEFGSLRDGRYTLTALASQITVGGLQLDGDGNGIGGDNFTFGDSQGLFRFFGDINGDRHVDIADFALFSSTFNLSAGQTGFLAAFDFNSDGHIDIADFGQFSVRFFTTLP
jgi:autotransporter-associated beta strand protein